MNSYKWVVKSVSNKFTLFPFKENGRWFFLWYKANNYELELQ